MKPGLISVPVLIGMILLMAPPVFSSPETGGLAPGTLELNLGGNFESVQGARGLSLEFRGGAVMGKGLQWIPAGFLAYRHVSSLDQMDLGLSFTASRRLSDSSAHIFLGPQVALRQEWVGSFQQVRYPLGFESGVRILAASSAALTARYAYRRVLHDPVADFNEHLLSFGLSLLLRNH